MKAVVQTRYGSPDALELRDVARPEPGPGELLVRMRAASLHPDVWHVVAGRPYVLRLMGAGVRRPKNPIPGTDVSGVVEAVGPGVTRLQPGDPVFGETIGGYQWVNGGAFAEYVAVREDNLARKPDDVGFEQAAAVPTAGFIAHLNLRDVDRWPAGRRVLVNGAGGGVGSVALQLAKAHGAHVTAVDGPGKLDLLRSLGADAVIDYTREDFTRRGVRYDVVFDVPCNHPFSAVRRALEPDGRYVVIGHDAYGAVGKRLLGQIPRFGGLMATSAFRKQLRGPRLPAPTKPETMALLSRLLAEGKLTPVIDRAYPLAEVREAFRHMMEDELRGRVVLVM